MKTIITMCLLLASQLVFSQQNSLDSLHAQEIGKLVKVKDLYEYFKAFAGKGPEGRYVHSRDSCYGAYLAHIAGIKKNAAQYIRYIDKVLQNPEFGKNLFFYSYPPPLLSSFDPRKYKISMRDFYRVIKHTLLERDAEVLSETLEDIPFPIKRDYEPFKLQVDAMESPEKSK